MALTITKQALSTIHQHAESDYPNECCGFFYGLTDGDQRRVSIVQEVENAKEGDQRRRFQIAPQDYQKAEKYAIDHELDLLGVYHSHPDHPAKPSEHDRKVAMPYFSYIIIPVQDGKAGSSRSWRLTENQQFDEEPITIKEFSPEV